MFIKVLNLKKTYHLKGKEKKVIDDISVNFEKGKFYAIMGHSGSGKSTFIHCLGLLENIDAGKIYVNDKLINELSETEKAEIRSKEIGFVSQKIFLSPKLKAYENVMLSMYINNEIDLVEKKQKAIRLLNSIGLKDKIYHFTNALFDGEQQRVAIAKALANNPSIILADEPTGNFDSENEIFVMEMLRKLANEGKCVIVVSHNEVVKKYADKVLYMNNGKLRVDNE